MLWLCITFPRLPFDALSLDNEALQVVTLQHKRTRYILTSSKAAEKLKFVGGMNYAVASALCENLKAIERNPAAERRMLERLAAWAYQWSSFVTFRSAPSDSLTEYSMLWLELAGSCKLFGGLKTLIRSIEQDLNELHYKYRMGAACSLEGAALLARAGKRVVASNSISLRRNIANLPISLLALDEAVIFELQRAGIRTIKTFIDLPKDAIAKRFGPKVNDYLDRLLGLASDPRSFFQLPKHYHARLELGVEVTNTEALLFPLKRMLRELQGYLRAIDCGLQSFALLLKHRQHTTKATIGFYAPERHAEQFFVIVRERLERLTLPAPVLEIELTADRFTDPAIQQASLFRSAAPTESFEHVLDKLNARLGHGVMRYSTLVADHRPEKAWVSSAFSSHTTSTATSARPLWLLPEPKKISAPAELPKCFERIEGGWWDGDDAMRDYYVLHAANGAQYWVYRDLKSDEWFVHGLWS